MAGIDIESQNGILSRQSSGGKRSNRYIPEVTADNLSSRIRLEPRHVGRDGNFQNSFLSSGAPGQAVVNKIATVASG